MASTIQGLHDADVMTTRSVMTRKADVRDAVLKVVSGATRSLAIFTGDLEPGVYDDAEVLNTIKQLVLSRSYVRIRVLVADPERALRRSNRFVHLARRLSSFVEFRQLGEKFLGRPEAFLVADESGVVYRSNRERWDGVADTREPAVARLYLQDFDQMWQDSTPAPETRRLSL